MTQRFPEGAYTLIPGFELGASVEPGLPNFGGTVGMSNGVASASGLFKGGGSNRLYYGNTASVMRASPEYFSMSFSAASSLDTSAAAIYGKSTTVQPPSLGVKFIIKY